MTTSYCGFMRRSPGEAPACATAAGRACRSGRARAPRRTAGHRPWRCRPAARAAADRRRQRLGRPGHERGSERRSVGAAARARRGDDQRRRQQADASGHARQRADRRDVERDQQHRALVGRALGRRLEQAGGEARIERGHGAARRMAAGGDGPVAGGGVVHRVVKARRRDRRRLGRERRAHVVVDREVAVRRGEDRGQRRPGRGRKRAPRALATSRARATLSGARRRSAGARISGAGRLAGGSTGAPSPRNAARAIGQPGSDGAQKAMPSTRNDSAGTGDLRACPRYRPRGDPAAHGAPRRFGRAPGRSCCRRSRTSC